MQRVTASMSAPTVNPAAAFHRKSNPSSARPTAHRSTERFLSSPVTSGFP